MAIFKASERGSGSRVNKYGFVPKNPPKDWNEKSAKWFIGNMQAEVSGLDRDMKWRLAGSIVSGWEGMVYDTPVRTGFATNEWQIIGAGENPAPVRDWGTREIKGNSKKPPKRLGIGEFWVQDWEQVPSIASEEYGLQGNQKKAYLSQEGAGVSLSNYRTPKQIVHEGAEKIKEHIYSEETYTTRNGKKAVRMKPIKNFQIVNTSPYILLLEKGYSQQSQNWISTNFLRTIRIWNAEKGKSRVTRFQKNKK